MPAFDRKARIALIATLAGAGLIAWFVVRHEGGKAARKSAIGEPATEPGVGGDPPGVLGRLPRPAPSGLRVRVPGPVAQVTGIVRMAITGTPVAGAEVAFMNETGETTATADGSGKYTIQVASGVRWKVHARTDSAVGYPEPFEVTGTSAVRDLEVTPLGTVRGRVVDGRGAAVAGADVNIEVDGAVRNLLESAVTLATQSDDQGHFELRALAGGAKVRAARGMAQGLANTAVPPDGQVEIEVRLQAPVRLRGQVVDRESKPQAGATIKALAALESGVYERAQLTADGDGHFDLELPAGWVRLEAATANGDRAPVWNQSLVAGNTVDNVQLVVSAGEVLRGQVVTADGTPVVGARIRLVAASTFDAVTSGDGRFELSVPERIPYLVKVRHSDGYVQRQVDTWGDSEQFVMPRFGRLAIKVANAASDAKVQIDAFVPAGEAAPRAPADANFRGSKDAIDVDGLEPGHYWLTVSAASSFPVRVEVTVPADGVAQVSVDLGPPTNPGKLGVRAVAPRVLVPYSSGRRSGAGPIARRARVDADRPSAVRPC